MNNTKQMWLSLEQGNIIKLIAVKSIIEEHKDITIKDLIDSYKEFTLRLLIA